MKIPYPKSKQPIPKDAKKVFTGEIFDIYQWQQKLFDGSFTTFEKIERKATVMVLPITNKNKIILTKQSQPIIGEFISLLGGRVDNNENPLIAAQRELLEESGYKAKDWNLWKSYQFFEKIEWPNYIFIAKNLHKTKSPNPDAGEKIELIEYSFDDFIKLTSQKFFRDTDLSLIIYQLINYPQKMEDLKRLMSI